MYEQAVRRMVAPLARRTPTDRSHHIHFVEIGAFLGQSSCYMAQLLLRQNQRDNAGAPPNLNPPTVAAAGAADLAHGEDMRD